MNNIKQLSTVLFLNIFTLSCVSRGNRIEPIVPPTWVSEETHVKQELKTKVVYYNRQLQRIPESFNINEYDQDTAEDGTLILRPKVETKQRDFTQKKSEFGETFQVTGTADTRSSSIVIMP